jgi:glycerol-3-phosphate acyltransferase PlsX
LTTPRIALDAFGGDDCPRAEVEAAVQAAREGVHVIMVGDQGALEGLLTRHADAAGLPIEIRHASEVIGMDEAPAKAVRGKTDASMPVCFGLVRAGEAGAVVSAGNSGAMLACGLFKYGRIKGVDRPAIVTNLPTKKGVVSMLDVGANVECRPVNLVQFAAMGAVYARLRHDRQRPKVGLLSNGSEEGKGTELTRATHQVLEGLSGSDFEYAGNVEGKDVFSGDIDVVVTDGFTGNIALKMAEGAGVFVGGLLRRAVSERLLAKAGALLMKPALDEVRRATDLDSYGGALLLGVDGIAMICHGGAGPRGIARAIGQGARFLDQELTPAVRAAIDGVREIIEGDAEANDGPEATEA